jgi:hypothetical protein
MLKVNLKETFVGVVSQMMHNNYANGLTTQGRVIENGETIYSFTTIDEYLGWWKSVYGNSEFGLDGKYIILNCP